MAEEFGDKAFFAQIDVDKASDVAQELGISAMPTFTILIDGKPISSVRGANEPALKKAIVDAIASLDA